jgi:hypothetical protein
MPFGFVLLSLSEYEYSLTMQKLEAIVAMRVDIYENAL